MHNRYFILNLFLLIFSIHANSVFEYQNDCKSSIKSISHIISELSQCFMLNLGSNSTCLKCNSIYQKFINDSNYIRYNVDALNGLKCLDAIDKADEFKTVKTIINNISKIWNHTNCDLCFINNAYHSLLKNFIEKHNFLLDCMQRFTDSNISLCDGADFPFKKASYNISACKTCYSKYTDLLRVYQEIREDNNQRVCGDIENLFKCARLSMEEYFKCPKKLPSFINSWPIIVIFATTLIFYSCSTICHDKNQIEIYNQSRVMACFAPDINSIFGGSMTSHRINMINALPVNSTYESDHEGSLENSLQKLHMPNRDTSNFLTIPTTNENRRILSIQS